MDIKQTILFLRKTGQRRYYYFQLNNDSLFLKINLWSSEKELILNKSSDGSYFMKIIVYDKSIIESEIYFLSLDHACIYIENRALADFIDIERDKIKSWDWELFNGIEEDKPINFRIYPNISRFILWKFLRQIEMADKYSLYEYKLSKRCVIKNDTGKWSINDGVQKSFNTKKEAYLYIYKKEFDQFVNNQRKRLDFEKMRLIEKTEKQIIDIPEVVVDIPIGLRKYRDKLKESAAQNFLNKMEQNCYFRLDEKIINKDEINGFSYDIKRNLYRTVYYDRGKYIWGKYFISYSDVTFYMCMQAYTVFKEKQRLLIEQWKKELEEEKTWFDLHFLESWKKKPNGYRPFSEWRLIHFLGNLKYGNNEPIPGNPYKNTKFRYTGNRHTSWKINIDGESKRFHILQSAWKYVFKKEYKSKMRDYIQTFGSKKGSVI